MLPLASKTCLLTALTCARVCSGQPDIGPPEAKDQLNTFNSTPDTMYHKEVADLIDRAGLDNATSQAVQVAADFERSNWATGSVRADPFYNVPENASASQPGDVLRVEQHTNTTNFTLPPNLALSRFLYQTEDFNGSSIPASGFVLWPWAARNFPEVSGYPIVAWAHGTSGISPECAPSHIRNLWYQYSAPFTLALQGYVVIGVDYAGLGVGSTGVGQPITHQWGANPAGANDVFYAVEAAQKAFPRLSRQFVVMGHSQGGGVAWAAAERQAQMHVDGYLGAVAGSPTTNYLGTAAESLQQSGPFVAFLAPTVASIFPEFRVDSWLTGPGTKILNLFQQLNGCQSVRLEVFGDPNVSYARAGWNTSWEFQKFNDLASSGGKTISGPLLILQGTADDSVNPQTTTLAVNETCALVEDSNVQYVLLNGATHVPALFASQQIWLDWIAARFNQEAINPGCQFSTRNPIQPVEAYEAQINYFLELPEFAYETA